MMRSRSRMVMTSLLGLCVLLTGPLANAQDEEHEYVPEAEVLEVTEEAAGPWQYELRLGLGVSFGSSKRVIGNVDGNTWTIGLQLDGGAAYSADNHEWRNTLLLTEAFTRTPVIDEFVKTGDLLEFESIYLYHLPSAPWFGPFARFRIRTAVLPGTDVRAGEETYVITYNEGPIETVVADRLELTNAFAPLSLREAVGVFFQPATSEEFQFEALLGFGSRQVFADGQLAVQDDGDTPEIEVIELKDFVQAGAELVLSFWGDLVEGRLAWQAGAEFMIPFINDLEEGDDRDAFELTNIDLYAGLSLRIVDWASVEYSLRAVREPQLLDDFQITNNLLLTVGYTLFASEDAE